jgi:hypothetical protein
VKSTGFSARGRQRGAVFVEAIIVCSLLILFLVSGLFLHRVYAQRIANGQSARAVAWSQALDGCSEELDAGNLFRGLVRLGSPAGLADLSIPDQVGPMGHTTGSAATDVRAPHQVGGRSYHVAASTQLACNERIQGERGDLFDIAIYAAQSFLVDFF